MKNKVEISNNNQDKKIAKTNTIQNVKLLLDSLILFAIFSTICFLFIFYPLELSKYILPTIYLTTTYQIIACAVIFALTYLSYAIIEKQGYNKKLKLYIALFLLCQMLAILFSNILNIIMVSLFINLANLFFALLIVHELKKTNLYAHVIFLIPLLITIYQTICTYTICMIN